ncbi:MAG: nucleotide exchange factor GrpE [Bryobacteraceae bacterium]|jgi:molecular chaperone GrpE
MSEEKQFTESADAVPEPAAGTDLAEVTEPAALLAAITAERDQLAKEKADLYDQFLRRSAEFENLRRRSQRERSEILEFAGMEAVRELLPILDDFERALKAPSSGKEHAKGMELIYNRLFNALRKIGLEPQVAEGQKFDPNVHHAVETVVTGKVEDHTVVQELQRGYNFKGRLLRPAMVKVAVQP